MAMTMIVNKFAKYERFRSIDGEQRSVGVRIFFFKLANTGLIVLLMDDCTDLRASTRPSSDRRRCATSR